MIGARSPAVAATLVNLAWNGSPEGFPRGTGVTPRDAIPPYRCARADSTRAGTVRIWRRVSMYRPEDIMGPESRYNRQSEPASNSADREFCRLVRGSGPQSGRTRSSGGAAARGFRRRGDET